ncbi:DUF4181 domain-containing protein [Sporosarcina aquimarina]|uniref:DUF4181 domain-containing protein n=1 Tax=Sporosarcina aquimarina TaxID=114975 RepID=UPI00203D2505|nr:DUF4181 domain-containing protein [Sporosarcina aquimarina]MCM3757149.1 DUF4181 domain-containing protein [Sporosarcina aquimarina]
MDSFLGKLIIAVVLCMGMFYLLDSLLRRYLKLEKVNFFKNNYVNDKHQKIDWILRFVLILGYLLVTIIMSSGEKKTTTIFIIFVSFSLLNAVVLELVRAYLQKKYAEHKNEYIPTLIQLCLLIIVVPTLLYTKFFGWFD